MRALLRGLAVGVAVGSLLGLAGPAGAQDAAELPAPRVLPAPEAPPIYVPPPFFRTDRYAVWQNYGVDRVGHFRPLVVYSPSGSYYRYDGQPYPWIATHQRDFLSRLGGTPYQSPEPALILPANLLPVPPPPTTIYGSTATPQSLDYMPYAED